VALSAWFCGLGGGVLAAILSSIAFYYLFEPPVYSFAIEDSSTILRLLFYAAAASLITALIYNLIVARQAAEVSEEQYQKIGALIPFGVWRCDAAGVLVYVSDALLAFIGKQAEQVKSWADVVSNDDAAEVTAEWERCLKDEVAWDLELRITGQNGEACTVLSRGVPKRVRPVHVVRCDGAPAERVRRGRVPRLGRPGAPEPWRAAPGPGVYGTAPPGARPGRRRARDPARPGDRAPGPGAARPGPGAAGRTGTGARALLSDREGAPARRITGRCRTGFVS